MKLASPRQQQGAYFEQLACDYLQQHGLQLVAKNWHCPAIGELDLVMLAPPIAATQPPCLVFVEVRQRRPSRFGTALDSITPTKRRKLLATAQAFLQAHDEFAACEVRFDVVSFDTSVGIDNAYSTIAKWMVAAFDAEY